MTAFATDLLRYDFERIGLLSELSRREIPIEPGLYALVATAEIRKYTWEPIWSASEPAIEYLRRKRGESEPWIEASEVIYIGESQEFRTRFDPYRQFVSGSRLEVIKFAERGKMRRIQWVLHEACLQRVLIDVYVRPISPHPVIVSGLLVDLQAGAEAALIRDFNPKGNVRHRTR